MARISIGTLDKATPATNVAGFGMGGETMAYFAGDKDPIHVHVHRMRSGEVLHIAPEVGNCAAFVWQGAFCAQATELGAGSSIIVEHGAGIDIEARKDDTLLVTFTATPSDPEPRAGGHVHLLPSVSVPWFGDSTGKALGGSIHANATCPTCGVWLHENSMACPPAPQTAAERDAFVHSHTEDEVIFVTGGQIYLGRKLFEAGTAIAIPANTLYSFTPGPMGLTFINFRPGIPGDIHFKDGRTMDETGYWREKLGDPQPITFAMANV